MKKVLLILVGILALSSLSFADEKKGWFENDIDNMSYEMKKEMIAMYHSAKKSMLDARVKVVHLGDKLATAIENKASEVEKNKYIQDMANEIATATDDTHKGFNDMLADGKAFGVWVEDQFSSKDLKKHQMKMFTGNGVKEIYDILEEAGVKSLTKKEIRLKYGKEIANTDLALKSAYFRYLGFWLAGITSGKDFDAARAAYVTAIANEIQLVSSIYSDEIAKLNKQQLADVTKERQKETKEQIEKIHKKNEKLDREVNQELKK